MSDKELAALKMQLDIKTEKIAGLSAFAAVNEIKAAAILASTITVELARRELVRSEKGASHE